MNQRPNYRVTDARFHTKGALHEHVRQMLTLERLCTRFQRVVTQLRSRHGAREALRVDDEYDVQDLLHALLHLEYDDVRPETWTPSYTGGRARTDFLLKLERIVLVARHVAGFDATALENQVAGDVQHYKQHTDCKTLVCFIYDPAGRIANPRVIENKLSGDKDGVTVRVIVAPKSV